jgi:putative sigma-54 modulation protein
MGIKVQSIHFDADKELVQFVEGRVEKLNHLFDGIVGSEVSLKLEKSNSGENKVAEIKIMVPGKDLFAKKQCKSFEEATDEAVEALRKQITKHKGKNK